MTWASTLRDPCLFCGEIGHKHKETCELYHCVDIERCKIQHSLFLRSCGGGYPFKYECQLCSMPPIVSDVMIKQDLHPLCAGGVHYLGRPL